MLDATFKGLFFSISILVLSACGGSGGDPLQATEEDLGDETFYLFDEESGATAFNSSFDGLNGEVVGAQRVEGKVNNALYFGLDLPSYVHFPLFDSARNYTVSFPDNELSIESWVNFESLDIGETYHYFGDQKYGLKTFKIEIKDGQFVFTLYTNSSGSEPIELIRTAEVFGVDTWYYIAFTYNGSEAKFYINGELSAQSNIISPVRQVVNSQYLGGVHSSTGTTSFPGYIDEFRFTIRERSEQEITDYYNATR